MDISAVTSASVPPMTMSGASRMGGSGSEDRMQAALGSAATLFGMSQGDLAGLINSGQSLSGVAASKGVTQADLLNAIKQGIQQATPQGAAGPSGALLDKVAGRIAAHTGGQVTGAHHRHHGGHAAPTDPAAAATPRTGDPGGSNVTMWL